MLLEITALVVACGAAITGLFGMNLVSNYEEHRFMFYWVSGFIVALMGGVGVVSMMLVVLCGFASG